MFSIDQWIKESLRGGEEVSIDYANGAFITATECEAFIRYNTGDCIWLQVIDGTYQVIGVDTNDDIRIKCLA